MVAGEGIEGTGVAGAQGWEEAENYIEQGKQHIHIMLCQSSSNLMGRKVASRGFTEVRVYSSIIIVGNQVLYKRRIV
jgi:hypothetical protein